jgi:arsenate reductase
MAEGWARHLHGDRFSVWSAGIETHGLNPLAVQVMKEAGVDISGHHSKLLEELEDVVFDRVITVCGHADEHCPLFPDETNVTYHGFDDPPRMAEGLKTQTERLDTYRKVCSEIRSFVEEL